MRLNTHMLFLPSLFIMNGVLAQLSAEPSGGAPTATYPDDDAFVLCSGQDCTGTCEVVDSAGIAAGDGRYAPGDMGFLSIYWYDPGSYAWDVYTCPGVGCTADVQIGPNTCYNLYDNGVPTDFYEFFFYVQGGYGISLHLAS
ncbi:hypothetical protein J3R83DRAFT_1371 [Lanmaoa asiatica]|nr:hypothetical protein J3R83DRAFT_1371 [Lanmaoa asiatica]